MSVRLKDYVYDECRCCSQYNKNNATRKMLRRKLRRVEKMNLRKELY